jgi:hypothetical protein
VAARREDEVTDKDEGPAEVAAVTEPVAPRESPMKGFAASMTMGIPPSDPEGEPESAPAVETPETPEAPKEKTETPETAPVAPEEKPAVAETVNFDGLSAPSKAYWEKALKAGHATPEDVKRAREESLFQSAWSKRNNAKDEEVKAIKAQYAKHDEDLKLLAKIRGDEKLLARWERMSKDEVTPESGEDLTTEARAAEIARKVIEADRAATNARTAAEQATFDKKKGDLQAVVTEIGTALGIKVETLNAYLAEEANDFPADVDPVEYAIKNVTPSELRKSLVLRHKAALAEAKAAALESQVTQRASKQVQTSKQSLPPARRSSVDAPVRGIKKILSEMGVARLGDVQGFGFQNGQDSP